ncbi:unnamed protein product [marine sediment metagenome]|uniref:Uncharacterized protein n=1 Tax=marine sediment metagenome TaxID=412755 RepID=X1PIW0_9ZZZZ
MKDETKIIITAITAIALLEALALYTGLDGALFGLVVAVISGLAGYEIKTALTQIKK